MEIVSAIGERFREYRLAALLTQQEMADLAGVSKTTVYSFENGRLPNVSLRTVVDSLRSINMIDKVEDLLPEIPVSPYLMSAAGIKGAASVVAGVCDALAGWRDAAEKRKVFPHWTDFSSENLNIKRLAGREAWPV